MKQLSAARSATAPHHTIHTIVGRQTVVIGAGIAGLAAAGALADWFEHVIVLERDELPDVAAYRTGTPQASHVHGLLLGGLLALEELFPGIGEDFVRAGAVSLRLNQDFREELPHRDPMPQRDLGLTGCALTRPVIEFTLRRRVAQRSNVVFRQGTRVLGIIADPQGRRVAGVRGATTVDERTETLPAELVVDASGRGQLTMTLLQSSGRALPRETAIGIDIGYTTAILDIPEDAPSGWKVVLTHHDAPRSNRRSAVVPIERNRWMLTVSGRGDERPPGDWDALLAFMRQLPTRTIYNAVRKSRPIGRLTRYGFPESVWRHFEQIADFPDGLVPIGDAICRFNPVYGQGMTVAAKEATLLHHLIEARASAEDSIAGLSQAFLAEAKSLIATPWTMAAIPDFVFPYTRGDRPADLEHSLQLKDALARLAVRDAAVQKLVLEVWHMLKPHSALEDPDLKQRVKAEMASAAPPLYAAAG